VLEALKNCEGNFHSDFPLESTSTNRPGGFASAGCRPAVLGKRNLYVSRGPSAAIIGGPLLSCNESFYLHYVIHNDEDSNNTTIMIINLW
jgi:hypothetical protein